MSIILKLIYWSLQLQSECVSAGPQQKDLEFLKCGGGVLGPGRAEEGWGSCSGRDQCLQSAMGPHRTLLRDSAPAPSECELQDVLSPFPWLLSLPFVVLQKITVFIHVIVDGILELQNSGIIKL